jgi:type IV pilus assembly protein PilE
MHPRAHRGFTLVELMAVVAIVGILAAIAYPIYTDSVFKGRRAEGRTAIAELLQQQERYMTQRNTYLAFTNTTGTTVPASAASTFKVYSGSSTANAYYWLSATTCTGLAITECVLVQATPIRADPQANVLTMTSTGEKSCNGSTPSVCWK